MARAEPGWFPDFKLRWRGARDRPRTNARSCVRREPTRERIGKRGGLCAAGREFHDALRRRRLSARQEYGDAQRARGASLRIVVGEQSVESELLQCAKVETVERPAVGLRIAHVDLASRRLY